MKDVAPSSPGHQQGQYAREEGVQERTRETMCTVSGNLEQRPCSGIFSSSSVERIDTVDEDETIQRTCCTCYSRRRTADSRSASWIVCRWIGEIFQYRLLITVHETPVLVILAFKLANSPKLRTRQRASIIIFSLLQNPAHVSTCGHTQG